MTEPTKLPGSDLVGVGWLKLLDGLPADRIATVLPKDDAPLRLGFVRTMIVGGSPAPGEMPWRAPVITAECWAAPQPGSVKLPWGVASNLAEIIVNGAYARTSQQRRIVFTGSLADFIPAKVATVIPLTEPRRIEDPSGFARFDVDLLINWRIDPDV